MPHSAISYQSDCRTVQSLGMGVVDGLALTFSCADYPDKIRNMNGWPVEHVAAAVKNEN